MSKQESDSSIIDSQFKNTNQSVSQFKKNLNFGEEIVDIKWCLRSGREPLIDLWTVKQANFISGMLQQQGKEKEKFICIPEKNIPAE